MRSPKDLKLCGGLPCLDFVNSLDWRLRSEPEEWLCSYDALLEWSVLAGVLGQSEARRLKHAVAERSAKVALKAAIDFREASYRVLYAAMQRSAPRSSDLKIVNAIVSKARSQTQLESRSGAYVWSFADSGNADVPLWIVSLSLAGLLTSEELKDVRECGGPGCGWLFLDSSKNHKRRWCSMEGCGNRAKARRHYARTR